MRWDDNPEENGISSCKSDVCDSNRTNPTSQLTSNFIFILNYAQIQEDFGLWQKHLYEAFFFPQLNSYHLEQEQRMMVWELLAGFEPRELINVMPPVLEWRGGKYF